MEAKKMGDVTILQIDGSVITGLLVFLTLTSLIPIVPGPFSNVIAILLTATVIFPFAISALMILLKYSFIPWPLKIRLNKLTEKLVKYSGYSRNATFWGFVYLMGAIIFLIFVNSLPILFPSEPSPIRQVCEKNAVEIAMTNLCTKIKPGSLYEECVKKTMPNMLEVKECSRFMTD